MPFRGFFACSSIPRTMPALRFRSSVRESPYRRLGLLFSRSPSSHPASDMETRGPPEFPNYPFACMPCSHQTPVVPCRIAFTRSGLLPSAITKASAFLPASTEVILLTTISKISGLNNTACMLATPGSIRPLTRAHAGLLPACRLDSGRMGLKAFPPLTHWIVVTDFISHTRDSQCLGLASARRDLLQFSCPWKRLPQHAQVTVSSIP